MSRTWTGALLALVMMTGCMAEDPEQSAVVSQESAVEEDPAPPPDGADARMIHDWCVSACYSQARRCMAECPGHVDWCVGGCDGDGDICAGRCDTIWGSGL